MTAGADMSVYESIIEQIKRDIELGIYAEGERLPSCREFALQAGVNPNTVQRAYAALEEQGLVYSLPKKGIYARGGRVRKLEEVKNAISKIKLAGVSRGELLDIIDEVYKDDRS